MRASIVSRVLAPVLATLALTGTAQAASVSYFLDQSNALTDGVPYLQVTIADGVDGAIDFTVQALEPLLSIAGGNFGIQGFAFNVADDSGASRLNLANLPQGWRARENYRMSQFGVFDIKVFGGGQSRLDTLTFSITGIDGDTPEDYALFSSGKRSGAQFFAAHVAGFNYGDFCQSPTTQRAKSSSSKCVTSAFFAGSSQVPLPATAWLFLTGIAGVAVRARRRFTRG